MQLYTYTFAHRNVTYPLQMNYFTIDFSYLEKNGQGQKNYLNDAAQHII